MVMMSCPKTLSGDNSALDDMVGIGNLGAWPSLTYFGRNVKTAIGSCLV